MTETTNTGETTVIKPFPCSTLPPPPKPADIAAAGEYFRDGVKKLLNWYAGNALFFGAKKGIAEWESANSGQLP
jgi:hypothetical protein